MTQHSQTAQETFAPGLGREAVQRLSDRKQEPSWLREQRLQAWEIYEQTPTPTPQDRAWKYTDITRLNFDRFLPFSAAEATPEEQGRSLRTIGAPETRAGLLVQQDSQAGQAELDSALSGQGVIFCSLEEAVRQYPDLVREYFMTQSVPVATSKFTALHAAFWSGGAFVYVPRGVDVALPLQSLVWAQTAGLAIFPHVLVIAEPNSRVTLIDEQGAAAREGMALSDAVTEIIAKDGAEVRYVNLQRWDLGTQHFAVHRAVLGRDAVLRYTTVGLGARLSKLFSEAVLEGAGARSEMLGLFFGERNQRFDSVTLQDHHGPHTSSDLLYKAALRDAAQSMYHGLVRVGVEARGSDANQENRNLLLSERAKADSDPVLEILTSEVARCGHGATVGPVDEEQLYYAQCRGLTREAAERLLVAGFFASLVQRVPVVQVRTRLENAVLERVQTLQPAGRQ